MLTVSTGMKRVFAAATALPLLAALAGCDQNASQHITVGAAPQKPKDVVVEGLSGPGGPYGSTAPAYAKVTFKGERFDRKDDVVCIQVTTAASVALTCPNFLNETRTETVKELKHD